MKINLLITFFITLFFLGCQSNIENETIKNKYSMLVECLKRNSSVNDISIDDIQSILDEIEHMEI